LSERCQADGFAGIFVVLADLAGSARFKPTPQLDARYRHSIAFNVTIAYIAIMNSKQGKTLAAIFKDPVSGTIDWADIENLLIAVGCKVIEGSASRVRFSYEGHVASFHRPHPAKEAKKYQVRDAREYLTQIGAIP
jgi:hypothetical protein